ncbi:MAG: type II toxin-antitoxin system RelE/ParE family toxin [Sedimenticola sp.]
MLDEFRKKKLEKCYLVAREAAKAYGDEVARKYIQRINIIKRARNIDELNTLPGLHCHPLKGDRHGQYAVKLNGFYRLIFTLKREALEIVLIEEVSKHYGD